MNGIDEPVLAHDTAVGGSGGPADRSVREHIRRLVEGQPYGVLCVQGEGQPYGALVAFAFTEDLRHSVFSTPMATRKYHLLTENRRVAMLIDNRPDMVGEFMNIEAATVTGRARQIERGASFDQWAGILLGRHSYLESFVRSSSCALFRVDVVRFIHVMRFQEVRQWVPDPRS